MALNVLRLVFLTQLLSVCFADVMLQITAPQYYNKPGVLADGSVCALPNAMSADDSFSCSVILATSVFVPGQNSSSNVSRDSISTTTTGMVQMQTWTSNYSARPIGVLFSIVHQGLNFNATNGAFICKSCIKQMDLFTLDLSSSFPSTGGSSRSRSALPISVYGPYGSQLSFSYQLYCSDPNAIGINCDMKCTSLPKNQTLLSCFQFNQTYPNGIPANQTLPIVCLYNSTIQQAVNCSTCQLGLGDNGCIQPILYTGPAVPSDYSDFKTATIFLAVLSFILLVVLIGVVIAWRKKEVAVIRRRLSSRGRHEAPRTYDAPRAYSSQPRPEAEWLNPGLKNGKRPGDEEFGSNGAARRGSRDGLYHGHQSPAHSHSHSRDSSDGDGGPATPRREAQV